MYLYIHTLFLMYHTHPLLFLQVFLLSESYQTWFLFQNSIMVPHHNSRATIVAMVLEGTGRHEMACPHLSSQQQGEEKMEGGQQSSGGTPFQMVSASLSPGDVFVIPAGHPISVVASQNLRMLGFGVNGRNNQRNFLAGNTHSHAHTLS